MLKKIKECTYNQLYSYMITNLKAIVKEEEFFPYSLLMFFNNSNLKLMTNAERTKVMKNIFKELKEDILEMYIEVD